MKEKSKKPDAEQIEAFLETFREVSRPVVDIVPRENYLIFLAKHNLLQEDTCQVILKELNASHYKSGPVEERNEKQPPGDIWEFVIPKFNTRVYVKLKVFENRLGHLCAKCLSFHD